MSSQSLAMAEPISHRFLFYITEDSSWWAPADETVVIGSDSIAGKETFV